MATLDALFEEIVTNDKGLVNVAAKAVDRNGKVFFFMAITHALHHSTREGQLRSDGVFFWLGNVLYQKAAGRQKLNSDEPIRSDAVYFIASCSKLIASIAAMQCVDRGLLGLDDDVTQWLPELKDAPVISLSEPFNHMEPAGQAR